MQRLKGWVIINHVVAMILFFFSYWFQLTLMWVLVIGGTQPASQAWDKVAAQCSLLAVVRHLQQSDSGVKNKASRNIWNCQSFGNHAGLHICWLKRILMNCFSIRFGLLHLCYFVALAQMTGCWLWPTRFYSVSECIKKIPNKLAEPCVH